MKCVDKYYAENRKDHIEMAWICKKMESSRLSRSEMNWQRKGWNRNGCPSERWIDNVK